VNEHSPDARRQSHRPLVAALTGAVIISFSAIYFGLSGVSPATGTFFRAFYALIILQVITLFVRTPVVRTSRERTMAFVAGLFLAIDVWLWHEAIGMIGTGLATLIANSQVVIVSLVAWALLRERPSNRAFVSMPVVIGGLILITGLGSADAFGSDPILGVVIAATAAFFYSAFLLLYRQANTSLGPVLRVLRDVVAGSTLGGLAAGVVSGDIDFVPSWPAHGWLLALALGAQVGGWMLIGYALPRLPAAHTSFAILLQPSLTLVWGAIIFTERPSVLQWLGVAVVLAGITAVTLPGRRPISPAT
jgi:drug/metabolite transporter (DMT)-like permease